MEGYYQSHTWRISYTEQTIRPSKHHLDMRGEKRKQDTRRCFSSGVGAESMSRLMRSGSGSREPVIHLDSILHRLTACIQEPSRPYQSTTDWAVLWLVRSYDLRLSWHLMSAIRNTCLSIHSLWSSRVAAHRCHYFVAQSPLTLVWDLCHRLNIKKICKSMIYASTHNLCHLYAAHGTNMPMTGR